MKVPIDFNEMRSRELIALARKCCREFNDRELDRAKVVIE